MFCVLPPELSDHTTPYTDIGRARKIAHTRTQNKHLQDKRFMTNDINNHISRPNQPFQSDTDTVHVNKLKLYTENIQYITPPITEIHHLRHRNDYTCPFKHLTPDNFPTEPLTIKPTNSEPFIHLDPTIFTKTRFIPLTNNKKRDITHPQIQSQLVRHNQSNYHTTHKDIYSWRRYGKTSGVEISRSITGGNQIRTKLEVPPHGPWFPGLKMIPAIELLLRCRLYLVKRSVTSSFHGPLQFREQEKVTGGQIWGIRWLRLH
ncbi:hypothetical protein LAZ67_11002159 [Cordylochernes scorpioides]|uniref:Uncharacterized protein n=1 Tax=Cordylochernes scorpioides TaxID=51811 RepID=A0ABY6L1B1_9ARAC|nr:hypothetical protein LAZ67_11002159 [Cordylochernes scorpioides]